MKVLAPCSVGDLADRISILRLKLERIQDPEKREHIRAEFLALKEVWYEAVPTPGEAIEELLWKLDLVNGRLWELEDQARAPSFSGPNGMDVKPSAHILEAITTTNDRRAALKRSLNLLLGSDLIEEKSHIGASGEPA